VFSYKQDATCEAESPHSTATGTSVLTLVTHLGLPKREVHVGMHVQLQHRQTAPTPTPTHRHPCSPPSPCFRHFLPPFSACGPVPAQSAPPAVPADRTRWTPTHGTTASRRSLPLCLTTPGTRSTCVLAHQPPARLPAASGVKSAGRACFPVRALPWSRKAPAAETQHRLGIYCIWLFLAHRHQRGN